MVVRCILSGMVRGGYSLILMRGDKRWLFVDIDGGSKRWLFVDIDGGGRRWLFVDI